MFDDVVIGSGVQQISATVLAGELGDLVSSNASAFWIHDAYLGLGLTVFRNTDEGRKLHVDNPALNAAADELQTQPDVTGVDIGSGHVGIYLDVHLICEPGQIAGRVAGLLEFARKLEVL